MAAVDDPAASAAPDDDEIAALARRFLAAHVRHTTVIHPPATEAPTPAPPPEVGFEPVVDTPADALIHAAPFIARRIGSLDRTKPGAIYRDRPAQQPVLPAPLPPPAIADRATTLQQAAPAIARRINALDRTRPAQMRRYPLVAPTEPVRSSEAAAVEAPESSPPAASAP